MNNAELSLLIVVTTLTGLVFILGAIHFYIRRRYGPDIHSYYDRHRQSVVHHRRSWRRKRFVRQRSIDGQVDTRWIGSTAAVPTTTTPTQSGSSCDENDAPVEVPAPTRNDDYRLSLILAALQESFRAEEIEDSAEEADVDGAAYEEMVAQFSDRTLVRTTSEALAVDMTESDQPQLRYEQTEL